MPRVSMPLTFNDVRPNSLLASLPDADLRRWLTDLELVHLPLGQVL